MAGLKSKISNFDLFLTVERGRGKTWTIRINVFAFVKRLNWENFSPVKYRVWIEGEKKRTECLGKLKDFKSVKEGFYCSDLVYIKPVSSGKYVVIAECNGGIREKKNVEVK